MVGQCCCIKNCPSKSHHSGKKLNNGIRFFKFPTWKKHESKQVEELTRRRRMAWVAAVRRKNITFKNITVSMKVCSLHFQSGQPAYEMLETHPDWKPHLLLGHNEVKGTDKGRYARRVRRCLQREKTGDMAGEGVEERLRREAEEMVRQQADERAQHEAEEMVRQGAVKWLQQQAEERFRHDAEERVRQEAEERFRQDAEERVRQEAEEMAPIKQEAEEVALQIVDTAHNPDDPSLEECVLCKPRYDEINRLLEENRRLKHELEERRMTEQFLKDDNDKVKYYTGLPSYATFQVLLCHIMPYLPQGRKELTPFQMILLTFMRLKLDLPIQHISHLFSVHGATVSAAFQDTVSVLYTRLSPLVHWPDRESVGVSMPHQFVETFGNHVAAVVDCFEVFVERPSDLQATAQTNSTHSHTLKYLSGITPQGVISFISKGWHGHTSDKQITENSGFLDKLLPGDIVLADRGFDIKESEGMMCAEVKTPASTKGRHQLDIKDVEQTRRIVHLRSHVKKMIGVVCNKYKILSSNIPISMVLPCEGESVTFLDKVVTVCCALTNMCPSVVQ